MPTAGLTIDLDEATALALRRLSERWGVPPTEVVKRAVEVAAEPEARTPASDALKIFRQLQKAVGLNAEGAEAWKAAVVEARR